VTFINTKPRVKLIDNQGGYSGLNAVKFGLLGWDCVWRGRSIIFKTKIFILVWFRMTNFPVIKPFQRYGTSHQSFFYKRAMQKLTSVTWVILYDLPPIIFIQKSSHTCNKLSVKEQRLRVGILTGWWWLPKAYKRSDSGMVAKSLMLNRQAK